MSEAQRDAEPNAPLSQCPDILSVAEAALILHLSQNTVRSLLMRQELPGKKVGMKWLIRKENLLRYLDAP